MRSSPEDTRLPADMLAAGATAAERVGEVLAASRRPQFGACGEPSKVEEASLAKRMHASDSGVPWPGIAVDLEVPPTVVSDCGAASDQDAAGRPHETLPQGKHDGAPTRVERIGDPEEVLRRSQPAALFEGGAEARLWDEYGGREEVAQVLLTPTVEGHLLADVRSPEQQMSNLVRRRKPLAWEWIAHVHDYAPLGVAAQCAATAHPQLRDGDIDPEAGPLGAKLATLSDRCGNFFSNGDHGALELGQVSTGEEQAILHGDPIDAVRCVRREAIESKERLLSVIDHRKDGTSETGRLSVDSELGFVVLDAPSGDLGSAIERELAAAGFRATDLGDLAFYGLPHEAYGASVLVFAGQALAQAVLDAVVAAVVTATVGRIQRRRRSPAPQGEAGASEGDVEYALILGPRGEVLRRFPLEHREDATGDQRSTSSRPSG